MVLERTSKRVEITLADGTTLSEQVEAVRGTVRNPMPRVEVVDKARDLIAALKTSAQKRLDDFTLIPPEEHQALLASLTKQETRL